VVKERNDSAQEVTTGYVGTGMIAAVYDSNGKIVTAYEIAVKGDVNGDGLANATDSYLIKSVRMERLNLTGVYFRAADINKDGSIDHIDQKLLLFHRAEVPGYIL